MASMRDIKRRKGSVQSTQQITKAMKLVSTVKLQKARARAESCSAYFHRMYETIHSILARTGPLIHPYLQENGSDQKAVILISSNRGLAGGYNTNVAKKLLESGFTKEETRLYALGRKAKDYLTRRGYQVAEDYSDAIEEPLFSDAQTIGRAVLEAYEQGQVGEIDLIYTDFKNTVTQEPRVMKLLPISPEEAEQTPDDRLTLMNYEPDEETVLGELIPQYIHSLIYGAMMQAIASENSARMQAMDNATGNAEEMIEELSLLYNRARQNSITQELTEIIAGAEAIG